MTSLSIYVERWYIVGAVCTDNVPHTIELPNGEDRIWLYFFEDIANDAVYYGRNNKRSAQNKENHYIDDVFSKIVEAGASFKKFGRNYPLSEIFKYSNVFDDLKASFAQWSTETKVPIYVSFSQDISYDAQNIFKTELEKNDFIIKQYVGKIDFLAIEWIRKKRGLNIPNDKHVLVLKSTNENLHMSLFKTDGAIFLEEAKDVLAGYGSDVRRHAVIEDVVNQGNSTFHFLTQEQDFAHEKIRMEEFVEDWILKLDHGRPGIPVKIPNVSFSLAPNNKFTANLKRAAIDERTRAIIRVIIDYVKNFVKTKNNLREYDLGAVLLLGNSFANSQYFNELDGWLQIGSSKMYKIDEASLPDVVGVYSQIDSGYFSTEENIFATEAGIERERQIKAEKEAKERDKAKAAADKARQSAAAKIQAEKKYKDAMDQAYEAESKHDFTSMREFLNIALDAKPNDDTASKKLKQLNDMEMKEGLKSEQYRTAINQADKALEDGDLDLAFSFYTQALIIDPTSDHAKARIEEVKKSRSDRKKATEYLTKADVLEGQKLFDKALTELRKAQLLDSSNSEIATRIAAIEASLSAKAERISILTKQIEDAQGANDFVSAINACDSLIIEDETNKHKWERKRDSLTSAKEQYEERTRILAECRKKVMDAAFRDNWDEVLTYSTKALQYVPNDDFYMGYQQKASKELAKKSQQKSTPTVKTSVVKGSNPAHSSSNGGDSFFDTPKKTSSKPTPASESFFDKAPRAPKKTASDDFFDAPSKKNNVPKKNPKDDFDF